MKQQSNSWCLQAQVVSRELIRVAILWHELWHEGLEEASRHFFTEKNPEAMISALEPLHDMLEAVRSLSPILGASADDDIRVLQLLVKRPSLKCSGENYMKLEKLASDGACTLIQANWTKLGISTMAYVILLSRILAR
jgi:phosphatidylinositol kinase/protein kinase (PI-3  family)